MTSGFMWVKIRGVPYVALAPNGQSTQYFSPGLAYQLGIESQLVAGLNLFGSGALILLGASAGKFMRGSRFQRPLVWVMAALALFAFSAELALFRRKVPGYPFRLLVS